MPGRTRSPGISSSITSCGSSLRRSGVTSRPPGSSPHSRTSDRKSSYVRFQAELPNGCWQADFTHWRLADGTDSEILTFLDDHSRFALSVTVHQPVTGPVVVEVFEQTTRRYGHPASVLSDNGMVFTARFAGGRGGRNGFETTLAAYGITQKNSTPGHPRTCGKVERFQQTLKRWLAHQPPATTTGDLQSQLDRFVNDYNHRRPHRSLPARATPAAAYAALPKDRPSPAPPTTHSRIRHDRVDSCGVATLRHNSRLHHISIGRTYARTPILLLVDNLDIRVINATTGQLLRHLTLDPTRDYQPIGTRKPQTPRT